LEPSPTGHLPCQPWLLPSPAGPAGPCTFGAHQNTFPSRACVFWPHRLLSPLPLTCGPRLSGPSSPHPHLRFPLPPAMPVTQLLASRCRSTNYSPPPKIPCLNPSYPLPSHQWFKRHNADRYHLATASTALRDHFKRRSPYPGESHTCSSHSPPLSR
jgi:hypothetical protein